MTERLEDLTPGAQELLMQLQKGSNIAEPRNYLAGEGYHNLARATLDNAVALCSTNSCDDFRIFSALYAVRHGLELWLKSLIVDVEMDRVLAGVAEGRSFDELKEIALQDRDGRGRVERGLIRSLCQFRNLALGLTHPKFRRKEIKEEFCDDAMEKLRAKAKESRDSFAPAWAVPIAGHDLVPLWERARSRFKKSTYRARAEKQVDLGADLLGEEQVSSACHLFGASDPRGDTFRYPSSLFDGDLHKFQSVSLEALGRFARLLDNTVNVYDGAIGDAYVNSTCACPRPMLD